jgi:hypothetical protein
VDDQALTKAETSRAAVLLTEVAKAAIAKIKREADMGWHYTKLYRYIDEIIGKTITRECAKILAAAKTKPLQFSAEAKARAARKEARTKLAGELREARSKLQRLKREIQFAEVVAANAVEAHAKEKRKMQAHRLLSARARLVALREAEKAASQAWTCRNADEKHTATLYPTPPRGIFCPNKDGSGIPCVPGIYFLWCGDVVEYVGQSINLSGRLRLGNHHILRDDHRIAFLTFPQKELTWAENYYIGALRCPLNYGVLASHARFDATLCT